MATVTTGLGHLDETLDGGILPGDNIVWITDDLDVVRDIAAAFLAAGTGRRRLVAPLAGADAPTPWDDEVDGAPVERIDLGWWMEDLTALESLLTDGVDAPRTRLVIDGLDDLAAQWGAATAAKFYARVCPRLFDLGATAYWIGSREVLSAAVVDEISKVAQCVFEVRDGHLRVCKAEGRPAKLRGASFHIDRTASGELRIEREHAIGRLGEGLRRIRAERNLTQSQLGNMAGVTAAAISQAEAGRRGLSLDTLVTMCEQLGIGLDDLLRSRPAPDHVLARREQRREDRSVTPLLDDPTADPRVYLVRLEPGESGVPPFHTKGAELVLVSQGLVLVDLGDTTPVMRPGDALKATRVSVRGWTNLGADPVQLFWVVLDPTVADAGPTPDPPSASSREA